MNKISQENHSNPTVPFLGFVFKLREIGQEIGLTDILDFYRGIAKGLVQNLDDLYLFGRLCFVRKVMHFDRYHRLFLSYFQGIELPPVQEGDPQLLYTKEFEHWLSEALRKGDLTQSQLWRLSQEELMRKFWDTVRAQTEAHHGGNRWVGTGGTSPFGHSGFSQRGIRVHGGSGRRSAIGVFGDRRYVSYDGEQSLSGENISQALGSLRLMQAVGPATELDITATIDQTAKNGGEIELIFDRERRNRLKLLVFFDNGGHSMLPFVNLVKILFSKIKSRFQDYKTFYFHNSIYGHVYSDSHRTKRVALDKILKKDPQTRVFIVGDACMAPEELMSSHGNITWTESDPLPSIKRIEMLQAHFPHLVWFNPIPKNHWTKVHGAWTLQRIRDCVRMEDLSLAGIRNAVAYLTEDGV